VWETLTISCGLSVSLRVVANICDNIKEGKIDVRSS